MGKLTRSQILEQAVSGVDEFSALRYLRQREGAPNLVKLEESGSKTLPNVAGALLDMYYSLWSPEASVKPVEEVPESLRYWHKLLGQALETTAYQQMHAHTQLRELESLVGTVALGASVLEMISEEDSEKLQQMAEAQEQANDAQGQMDQAQAQTDAAGEALTQMQIALGDGQPSDQAQQAMDAVQAQQQQAQAQAGQAQMSLEQAKQKLEQLQNELMGEPGSEQAQVKEQQMARMAQQAAEDAASEVKEVSEMLESWGLDAGELMRERSAPETLKLLERFRRSPEFKKFQELLGKMRHIAARKSKSVSRKENRVVARYVHGRDLRRADAYELARLVNPATRVQALQDWARGELRIHDTKHLEVLGKGPVVALEDGSSSMLGEKKLWSKAVVLALAYYARLESRTFVWIHFGSKTSRLVVRVYPNGQISPEQMLEIAETFLSSGTDFEVPLSKALEIIETEGLDKADVAMITDGECAVSDVWLKDFLARKAALKVEVTTVLMDVGSTSDATTGEFSDRMLIVSSFDPEAGGQVINHLR